MATTHYKVIVHAIPPCKKCGGTMRVYAVKPSKGGVVTRYLRCKTKDCDETGYCMHRVENYVLPVDGSYTPIAD